MLGRLIKRDIVLNEAGVKSISKHKRFLVFQRHSLMSDCLMLDTAQECGSLLWHEDKYSKQLNSLTFKVHLLVCISPHQKKALREKWLLDGLSSLTPKEQEEMQKQNREDQQRTRELEQEIFR